MISQTRYLDPYFNFRIFLKKKNDEITNVRISAIAVITDTETILLNRRYHTNIAIIHSTNSKIL